MSSVPPSRSPKREPILNLPGVVAAVIGLLLLIHLVRLFIVSEVTDFDILVGLAYIPARLTAWIDPARIPEIIAEAGQGRSPEEADLLRALASYVLEDGGLQPWTFLTYALLHGSWAHILLNAFWLAAFGTPVARRCGTWGFLLLGLAGAIGGALAHALAHPMSVAPMIGASAAVSAWMAAATRFVFADPRGGWLGDAGEVHDRPRQTIGELLRNGRAAVFLGVWMLTNIASGLLAAPLGVTDASIAWEAHIGGFLAGFLLFPLIDRRPRPST